MSYCLDTHSPVLGSESFMLQFLDRLAPCIVRPCVYRWATTQASFTHQTHSKSYFPQPLTLIVTGTLNLTPKPKIAFFLVGTGEMSLVLLSL